MPCLIITGGPSVGKTTFCKVLKERALQHKCITQVIIINEESACQLRKSECYADATCEKKTRGALKAEFDRSVAQASKTTLVVLDSMNYIKGFRYELHCLSKAAGERHGVVWILRDLETAKAFNTKRSTNAETAAFSERQMDELIQRYEPPDDRNRWDRPLYKFDLSSSKKENDVAQSTLEQSVYNMHALSDAMKEPPKPAKTSFSGFKRAKPKDKQSTDTFTTTSLKEETSCVEKPAPPLPTTDQEKELPTLEEQIDEMLDSFLLHVQPLSKGMSTQQQVTANANVLHDVDTITQQVIQQIMQGQKRSIGGRLSFELDGQTFTLVTRRTISLAELKRLRREYVRWVASHPPDDTSHGGIISSFLGYIEAQMI